MGLSMYTIYALKQNFSSPVQAFSHFYDKGIRYADVLDIELEKIPFKQYNDYLNCAGLKADALISMLNIAHSDLNKRQSNIDKTKVYLELLASKNIPMLMLAPDVVLAKNSDELKIMQENLIKSLIEITEFARNSGVTITIENQSVHERCDSKMKDIRYILDCVPKLGYTLDAGNFFCIGENVLEAFELLSDKIVHAHYKDWVFDEEGSFQRSGLNSFEGVAIGEGILPLKELSEKIRNSEYNGNIVLEINSKNLSLDMLDDSADYLRSEFDV